MTDRLKEDVDEMIGRFETAIEQAEFLGFSHTELVTLWRMAQIKHALNATNGNISRASRLIGLHRNNFARYMKRFGFDIRQWNRKGSRGAQKRKDRGVMEAPVYGNTI